MSIVALNWAIAQRLKPTPKLVLLALAHRHNQKTERCNPSLARLMADTGLSRSAIKSALRSLEARELIRVQPRQKASHDLSNQYRLFLETTAGADRARAVRGEGREPAPGRGSKTTRPDAGPPGPWSDPNKEEKGVKGPSQKKKGKRTQEKTSPRESDAIDRDDALPDDPFGEATS